MSKKHSLKPHHTITTNNASTINNQNSKKVSPKKSKAKKTGDANLVQRLLMDITEKYKGLNNA